MKTPTLEELEKARTCESTYHDLIVWWARNVRAYQSQMAAHMLRPERVVGFRPSFQYLSENCWFRTRPLTQENP